MLEIIAYLAAACTTLSFLPQAVLVWKTKNTSSISLSMYSLFNMGVLFWLIYGIATHQLPLVLANICTLCFSSVILWMKVKSLRQEKNNN